MRSEQRLICVAGTGSGGTSCVAGILHHLGVDMGRFMDRTGVRGYTTYEDTDAAGFRNGLILDIDAYVQFRMAAEGPWPRGFKWNLNWTRWDVDDLPLRIVHIRRPLEDSIASDRRIFDQLSPDRALRAVSERAGRVAQQWLLAHELAAGKNSVTALDFYPLLEERRLHVTALAAALGLPTEGARFNAAVRFVDAGKRHV